MNHKKCCKKILVPLFGSVLVSERIVAKHQMKAGLEIGLLRHDPFKRGASIRILTHLDKQNPNVVHNLDSHSLVSIGNLIKCHSVKLDGFGVLAKLEVNVTHVNLEPSCIVEHSVLGDHLIGIQGFGVHLIVGVLIGQIEQNAEGQI